MAKTSDLERAFLTRMKQLHPDIELRSQYPRAKDPHWRRIATGRQYTWDFVHIEAKVLIECQGGIYGKGRKRGAHIRPGGYERDCRKAAMAAVNGWLTVAFTSGMLDSDPHEITGWVADIIQTRLEARPTVLWRVR